MEEEEEEEEDEEEGGGEKQGDLRSMISSLRRVSLKGVEERSKHGDEESGKGIGQRWTLQWCSVTVHKS